MSEETPEQEQALEEEGKERKGNWREGKGGDSTEGRGLNGGEGFSSVELSKAPPEP
jgi:hypothetical protein